VTFVSPAASELSLKKGDVVTFSYENSSRREIPLGPRIVRVRGDLTWEDVVRAEVAHGSISQLSGKKRKEKGRGKDHSNFYFILFYFILFYFILFYFILFYFILFYYILLYFIIFYLFRVHFKVIWLCT